MTTVYLATSGAYSDYEVRHAFAKREDAESYKLGDNEVLELEVHDGPVEVRTWYALTWRTDWPEREATAHASANPHVGYGPRDFDGNEKHAEHYWSGPPARVTDILDVQGWDLALVKKVYSEQRAQYLARKEGIA